MKKFFRIFSKVIVVVLIIVLLIGGWVYIDMTKNDKIVRTNAKDDYARSLKNPVNDIMVSLEEGLEPDFSELGDTLAFIDGRYDCSDFRFPSLIRILYSHDDKLPQNVADDIKDTVINFKYWMDQSGDDSMCYWSENHQILFSTAEYLMGNYYKDEMFKNMDITGKEHSDLGKQRVLTWLEQRFKYGFTEWYSSTYYVEDIAPLSVLIDFAPDEEIRLKASMVMDLLIYDLATQNFKGTFTANSGRMYESAKMSGRHGSMRGAISHIWPEFDEYLNDYGNGMQANFYYIKNYEVPEVLRSIGLDQNEINIYKASTGVNLSEFKDEGLIGTNDNQIMMQWNSEAFTNKEIITNSIEYISKNGMFTNEFLHDFKLINLGFLKTFKLTPFVSTLLDPMYNGTAIQRANTYMYRTPDYAMSTAQAYHPGTYGDQHSLFSLNINNDFNIFVQQPAASLKEGGALGNSPNYWVGNGRHPHTVQQEDVNISLFILPEKNNKLGELAGMSRNLEFYSHAFFPKQYMDETIIDGKYAFGRINNVYVALIGKDKLHYKEFTNTTYDLNKGYTEEYDLLQDGRITYWITEVGTKQDYESFEEFITKIKSNEVTFQDETITYEGNKKMGLTFQGDFKVDDKVMDLEYKRFDSKYSSTERKSNVIEFEFNDHSLKLDFENISRVVQNWE